MSRRVHPAYRGPWRRVRQSTLERDQHRCQINGPGCTGVATEVDHIVPVTQGGAWYEGANLRAACRTCNRRRIDRTRDDAWRHGPTHITLVYGPPAAGKSTHVAKHARPGDLIVDYDAIAASLGARAYDHGGRIHPAVNAARNAILRGLRQGTTGAERAWITSANPDAPARFPHHAAVLIDPGLDACLTAARAAGRPADYERAIRAWYGRGAGASSASSLSRAW
jgi:hypothetical protein